jgi:hypothetical protein
MGMWKALGAMFQPISSKRMSAKPLRSSCVRSALHSASSLSAQLRHMLRYAKAKPVGCHQDTRAYGLRRGKLFKHRHLVASAGQEGGRGQAGKACADDGDSLWACSGWGRCCFQKMVKLDECSLFYSCSRNMLLR